MISLGTVRLGEAGHHIEPATSLGQHVWVELAEHRAGRRSAIGNGEAYGRPGPAQLGREEAAAASGRMTDRVCRQLSCTKSYVVTARLAGEQLGDEPPDVAHLVFPAREDPAPPHGAPRPASLSCLQWTAVRARAARVTG